MASTTHPDKRLATALQRAEVIAQAHVRYVTVMRAGRLKIGNDPGEVTHATIRDCRKYLDEAVLMLDAIEGQLDREHTR